jgi:hypothetical protein
MRRAGPQTDTDSWQEDPTRRHQHGYRDGSRWTEHAADNGGPGCYFAVRSAPTGFAGIIDNGNPDGPQIVDLAAGQLLESARSSPWVRTGSGLRR